MDITFNYSKLIFLYFILELFTPCDWILASRWDRENTTGIVFMNVYIPAHTRGFTPNEVSLLRKTFEDLALRFPGDKFVIGGDFNLDRERFQHERFKAPCLR